MKDYLPSELQEDLQRSSVATDPALPALAEWLADRPELWSAGREIQEELFLQAVRGQGLR